jgi:DNA-binding MarR family transcriptional regulator
MQTKAKDPLPDPSSSHLALESFLPYRLSLLSNTVSDGVATTYRPTFDIGVTEWRVIAVLGRFAGISASEVMQRTAMDKVAISRAVRRLQDKGLVERSADESDRRRLCLRLTPGRGVALFEEIVPRAKRYQLKLLDKFTQRELAQLDRLVSKLQQAAEQLLGEVDAN